MLYLYPSNKLEHLATLLNSVIQHNAHPPMQKRVLLVQHTGMQHWLSLQLAKESGIAMQLEFPLPTRFVWETCRLILGNDQVPQQSPYKREVMVWRILDIIRSKGFQQSPHAESLMRLWNESDGSQQAAQEFRFSQQLADLFEQYLVFRPDWILAWDANRDFEIQSEDEFSQLCYQWQKWFWRELIKAVPNHPVALQQKATVLLDQKEVEQKQTVLPEHIYLFAVNTMPKAYISFFEALSAFTHVHWFHLNPCVDYWADAKSDKAIARQMRMAPLQLWLTQDVHPLLRNFGKQGKDLLVELMNGEHMEISAFDPPVLDDEKHCGILQQLQSDILLDAAHPTSVDIESVDTKGADTKNYYTHSFGANTNIHVQGSYNEIRELQALKDFLLLQLEQDHALGLDDILVMCPAIEDYSPFIKGVFESMDGHHLASSISDRKPLESQASIVAFMQLLSIQDSRFSVQQILSLLGTPAILERFSLSVKELHYCAQWIENARISFALDTAHKAALVSSASVSDRYTWEWGIERLLSATFLSEEHGVGNSVAIAHTIEGQLSATIGKLIAFLSSLKSLLHDLQEAKSIVQWSEYFETLLARFFAPLIEDEFALSLIRQAINGLEEHSQLAQFDAKVPFNNVKQALDQSLNIPETKSRFMCGKITFCSMMPLRSIPFKVVAILGLNQSAFPRNAYPSELDLIGKSAGRTGDRSRRDDDRYLFLEALLSARASFYLSYQYRSIQTNAEREPSLVIKELVEHCHRVYSKHSIEIVKHPLHPFSDKNFGGEGNDDENNTSIEVRSFSTSWLRHAKALQAMRFSATNENECVSASSRFSNMEVENPYSSHLTGFETSVNALVTFFEDPMAFFSSQCLQLRFEQPKVSEYSQPFDVGRLQNYALRRTFYQYYTLLDDESYRLENREVFGYDLKILQRDLHHIERTILLSGDLPELPDTQDYLEMQKNEINALVDFLHSEYQLQETLVEVVGSDLVDVQSIDLESYLKSMILKANCQVDVAQGMVYPIFKEKPHFKDEMRAWISYLLLVISHGHKREETDAPLSCSIITVYHARGNVKIKQNKLPVVDNAQAHRLLLNILAWFYKGTKSPLFVNRKLCSELKTFWAPVDAVQDHEFSRKWKAQADSKGAHDSFDALSSNPYFHYFYGQVPKLTEDQLSIYVEVYLPMLRGIEIPDDELNNSVDNQTDNSNESNNVSLRHS